MLACNHVTCNHVTCVVVWPRPCVHAAGHYRLRSKCTKCPSTAWLLFLMFAVGLVVLVAASVYLSKKRLNLAALGIGVVR